MADFIDTIRRRYRGGRDRLFILHGNTADLFPVTKGAEIVLKTLPDYIVDSLTENSQKLKERIWINYSLATGARWPNSEANGPARIAKLLGTEGEKAVMFLKQPLDLFRMIDDTCCRRERVSDPNAAGKTMDGPILPLRVIVTDAHLIVPDAQTSFMRPEDRELLVRLKRFAAEPFYDESNTMMILVTDALSGIHRELRELAVTIEVSRPNEQEIGDHLIWSIGRHGSKVVDAERATLPRLVVGLSRRQVENVVVEAATASEPLRADILTRRRRELTTRDYGELLEFFDPSWALKDVGGSKEAVAELLGLADAFKSGDRDVPSGIILTGQNGIGKTFLAKAFLGTAGITGVVLKSVQDSLLGASERNWEKVATALRSAGQIGVLVDEADAQMGQRSGPNIHEVSKRLFAMQMQLMGDPNFRGKIFWILMTCRPDKLAPDVKRPGRCERMIPLFPIPNEDDAILLLRAQAKLLIREKEYSFDPNLAAGKLPYGFLTRLLNKTGAQIGQLLERAKKRARGTVITADHVMQVLESSRIFDAEPEAFQLQRYIALAEAIETENEDLIPEYYAKLVKEKGGVNWLKEKVDRLRDRIDRG